MIKTMLILTLSLFIGGWGYMNLTMNDKEVGDIISPKVAHHLMERMQDTADEDVKTMQIQAKNEADRMMQTGDFSRLHQLMQDSPFAQ